MTFWITIGYPVIHRVAWTSIVQVISHVHLPEVLNPTMFSWGWTVDWMYIHIHPKTKKKEQKYSLVL